MATRINGQLLQLDEQLPRTFLLLGLPLHIHSITGALQELTSIFQTKYRSPQSPVTHTATLRQSL